MAKSKNSRQSAARHAAKRAASKQVSAIIWLAVAVFWACIVFIKGEMYWTGLHNFMFSMLGITAFVFPVMLGAAAIMVALEKMNKAIKIRMIEGAVLAVLIGALIDIFANFSAGLLFGAHVSKVYSAGETLSEAVKGGGIVGTLISHPFCAAFGKTGAAITMILIIFVLFMIMTGTTLIMLFRAIGKPAKAVSQQVENTFADYKERQKELKVVKGFNVDIPVDSPETEEQNNLAEKKKKLVASYNGEEIPEEQTLEKLDDALSETEEAAQAESDEKPEKIKVDFEKETAEMTGKISENYIKNVGYIPPPLTLLNE